MRDLNDFESSNYHCLPLPALLSSLQWAFITLLSFFACRNTFTGSVWKYTPKLAKVASPLIKSYGTVFLI